MAKAASNQIDPTVVDAGSLFGACEVIAERAGRPKIVIDYSQLRATLDKVRTDRGWRPATLNSILLAVDPKSEGQERFQAMLRHAGFEPDSVHFRDCYWSLPPGRSPIDGSGKSIGSLAPRLAYIAGLMARHSDPQFMIASHSFELFGPLTDLARRVGRGRVGLAFFSSLLDPRWKQAGLLDPQRKLGVEFFDLDSHGEALVGVDLTDQPSAGVAGSAGLSRF